MKITVKQTDLTRALQKLQSVTPFKTAVPIYQQVLLNAVDHGLYCTATNGELSTRILVDGKAEENGTITVNCKKLAGLVKLLKTEEVNLQTTSNDRLQVLSGKGKYSFGGIEASEFPIIPEIDREEVDFIIPAGNLRAALMDTDFAASSDEVRYFLHGVSVKFYPDKIEFAACDGRMFAVTTYQTKIDKEIPQMVIPLKSCHEIKKVFTADEDIFVSAEKNYLVFFTGSYQFSSQKIKLEDGGYPDYWKVISFANEKVVLANKDQLLESIQRIRQFAQHDNYGINLKVNDTDNTLELTAQTSESHGHEAVDISDKTSVIDFKINAKFLSDILSHLDCDDVMISMASDNRKITLSCPDNDNQIYMVGLLEK